MGKSTKALFFCSDKPSSFPKQGHWSKEEHVRFLEACYLYKNNWPKIKQYIQTRTIPQIRSHAQKFLIKICRKYEIKLSQKKFLKTKSKHLEQTCSKVKKFKKTGIANMNKYERNIYDMFNYYKRDLYNTRNVNSIMTTSTVTTIPETNSYSRISEEELDNINCSNRNNIQQNNNLIQDNMLIYVNCINNWVVSILVKFYVLNYLIFMHKLYFPFSFTYDSYSIYLLNVLHLIRMYQQRNGE